MRQNPLETVLVDSAIVNTVAMFLKEKGLLDEYLEWCESLTFDFERKK